MSSLSAYEEAKLSLDALTTQLEKYLTQLQSQRDRLGGKAQAKVHNSFA